MKRWILAVVIMFPLAVFAAAEKSMKFNFRDADVVKVIEEYAKASGEKFIVDPSVKGKITALNSQPVTLEEAFNQLSTALMINGLAISKQGDTMVVLQARNVQRNMIDVVTELPPMKPEKMVTWVIKLKYVRADEVNKQLRILSSANGELVPYTHNNTLIISDFLSNLYRVRAILAELDQPGGGGAAGSRAGAGSTKSM